MLCILTPTSPHSKTRLSSLRETEDETGEIVCKQWLIVIPQLVIVIKLNFSLQDQITDETLPHGFKKAHITQK